MAKPLVLYHADCIDGFGAAYAVWLRHRDAEFVPMQYWSVPPSDVRGRMVYVLDFSFPLAVMEQLIEDAADLVWYDHHPQAVADAKQLNGWRGMVTPHQSGAVLTWIGEHPEQDAPPLLLAIQDYDLHQFKLPDTRADVALLCIHDQDFQIWHTLMEQSEDQYGRTWQAHRFTGYDLLRQSERNARQVIEQQQGMTVTFTDARENRHFTSRRIPVINCPRHMTGDVSKILLEMHPMCAIYYDTTKGRKWSLRSNDRANVPASTVAEAYGGGGHRHAAAFFEPWPYYADEQR